MNTLACVLIVAIVVALSVLAGIGGRDMVLVSVCGLSNSHVL